MRFPRCAPGEPKQAVLLNTAGGLTGGDHLDFGIRIGAQAQATVTTAAAEKIYRARDGETEIDIQIEVAEGAQLAWLPQATILFDRARFVRRLEVELAQDASFLAVETLVFGRSAMGETVRTGYCRDAWRIRRAGRLVFGDTFLADGPIARILEHAATLAGARATATIVYVAPDAEARIDEARTALADTAGAGGVSAWNGMLFARVAAADSQILGKDIRCLAEMLSGRPLPRLWHC
ncbi:MAG TPA: urease accessory protein UreD [Hyphomicrobiaceae bacterium]|nr:urease accessory protein UreD [Hyphomicrobiaceae bacterium]